MGAGFTKDNKNENIGALFQAINEKKFKLAADIISVLAILWWHMIHSHNSFTVFCTKKFYWTFLTTVNQVENTDYKHM